MGIYHTYGKRIINGFVTGYQSDSLFPVDKEALLNCLIECRNISLLTVDQKQDVLLKDLMGYIREYMHQSCPLNELDAHVSELLGILLGKGDDNEMAAKIRKNSHRNKYLLTPVERLLYPLKR